MQHQLEVIGDFQDIVGNVYTKNSGDAGAPLKKVKLMFDADIVIKSILSEKAYANNGKGILLSVCPSEEERQGY